MQHLLQTCEVPPLVRSGWAAPRFLDSLGEDLGGPRPPGHAGQQEEALVPRVPDRGDVVPLGKDGEDDLLGPGQARGSGARTTAVSSPRRLGSVADATSTPWSAGGVTGVLMARSRRS